MHGWVWHPGLVPLLLHFMFYPLTESRKSDIVMDIHDLHSWLNLWESNSVELILYANVPICIKKKKLFGTQQGTYRLCIKELARAGSPCRTWQINYAHFVRFHCAATQCSTHHYTTAEDLNLLFVTCSTVIAVLESLLRQLHTVQYVQLWVAPRHPPLPPLSLLHFQP